MLNDAFLGRLSDRYPEFYDRVNADAMEDASRILREVGGDTEKALVRARLENSGRVWWPYLRGVVPFVKNELPAMQAFAKLVLTVDHVLGVSPPTMEIAREQTVQVLRNSLDVERLGKLVSKEPEAAASAGAFASMAALTAPLTTFRNIQKYGKWLPVPLRITIAGVVVAAVLSVPLVAGYSAGRQAELAARNAPDSATRLGKKIVTR